MIVSLKPIKEEAATDLDYSAEKIEASMVANASLALSLYTRYHTGTVEIRIIRVRILFFFSFSVVPSLLQALTTINYTVFPDEDGVPHLIHLDSTPLSFEELHLLDADLNTITFTLFTRSELFLYSSISSFFLSYFLVILLY